MFNIGGMVSHVIQSPSEYFQHLGAWVAGTRVVAYDRLGVFSSPRFWHLDEADGVIMPDGLAVLEATF